MTKDQTITRTIFNDPGVDPCHRCFYQRLADWFF